MLYRVLHCVLCVLLVGSLLVYTNPWRVGALAVNATIAVLGIIQVFDIGLIAVHAHDNVRHDNGGTSRPIVG